MNNTVGGLNVRSDNLGAIHGDPRRSSLEIEVLYLPYANNKKLIEVTTELDKLIKYRCYLECLDAAAWEDLDGIESAADDMDLEDIGEGGESQ